MRSREDVPPTNTTMPSTRVTYSHNFLKELQSLYFIDTKDWRASWIAITTSTTIYYTDF